MTIQGEEKNKKNPEKQIQAINSGTITSGKSFILKGLFSDQAKLDWTALSTPRLLISFLRRSHFSASLWK